MNPKPVLNFEPLSLDLTYAMLRNDQAAVRWECGVLLFLRFIQPDESVLDEQVQHALERDEGHQGRQG